mmetsp:Transcript_31483/g.82249  ORF Transcript_31483/g.82249 Transcript_31483/m.82249 type:complete len:210 (+) Transcript_31483:933-1562(+)
MREKLVCVHGLCLRERHEVDVGRLHRAVPEGRRQRVEIVSADRHQRPSPAHVVVHAVLQVEERVVRAVVERAVAQDSADDERANLSRLGLDRHFQQTTGRRRQQRVLGLFGVLEEDVQRARHPLETEDVVAIGWYFDFVYGLHLLLACVTATRLGHLDRLLNDLVELNAKLKAQILEFILGELAAKRLEEGIACDTDRRHCTGRPNRAE